jgi:hypothetical protein
MVHGVDDRLLSKKQNAGWSVKEQIGHLMALEALHEGRLDDFIAGKQILREADMTNKDTETSNHNEKSAEILLKNFRRARSNFVLRLENADDSLIQSSSLHLRLKILMRMVDMVYFTCEHDDHHLAKIRSLILYPLPLS